MSVLSGLPGIRTRIQEARDGTPLLCDLDRLSGWLDACLDGVGRTDVSSKRWLTEFLDEYPDALFVPLAAAVEAVLDLPEKAAEDAPTRLNWDQSCGWERGYNEALIAVRAVVVAPFDPPHTDPKEMP